MALIDVINNKQGILLASSVGTPAYHELVRKIRGRVNRKACGGRITILFKCK